MIIIKQNSPNEVITTLKELQCKNICTNIYLFQIINATSNAVFYTIVTDKSHSPCRYQQFCITDIGSGVPDPTQGQVLLTLKGQYYYNVFSNPDMVLNPAGLNQVETGKLLVIGDEVVPTVYQSDVNPDLVFYKNTDTND